MEKLLLKVMKNIIITYKEDEEILNVDEYYFMELNILKI
jgi:hypothetical protein